MRISIKLMIPVFLAVSAASGAKAAVTLEPCSLQNGLACYSNGNDKAEFVRAAIFQATGVDVELKLYSKWDSDEGAGSSALVRVAGDSYSGTWASPVSIAYVTVKAGPQFAVYEWNDFSGSWFSQGLTAGNGKKKNTPAVSHVSFWTVPGGETPAVPEPATWLMMIAGFGLIGSAMRRRRKIVTA
ncbi:MAG: PEPxxWA-CTERM sorting domain-containing protein [Sphingomonadaceae bacterium]